MSKRVAFFLAMSFLRSHAGEPQRKYFVYRIVWLSLILNRAGSLAMF